MCFAPLVFVAYFSTRKTCFSCCLKLWLTISQWLILLEDCCPSLHKQCKTTHGQMILQAGNFLHLLQFTTRTLLLSDLHQVLTMWDYRSLHTSSLNKSIGFELCKPKKCSSFHTGSQFISLYGLVSHWKLKMTPPVLYFSTWVAKTDRVVTLMLNEQREEGNQYIWDEFTVLMYHDLF